MQKVKCIRKTITYCGARKLQSHLLDSNYGEPLKIGRDRLIEILRKHNLLYRRARRRIQTSISNPANKVYPNLLAGLEVTAPNQVWVTDITYLSLINGKHCYLFVMTDYYSRKIIGWSLRRTMEVEGAFATFNKAYRFARPGKGLIHHSDHGSQYTCRKYTTYLHGKDVVISMTGAAKCLDNAVAERINGILKYEFNLKDSFNSFESAFKAVRSAIGIYNGNRLHNSLHYMTPDAVYSSMQAA